MIRNQLKVKLEEWQRRIPDGIRLVSHGKICERCDCLMSAHWTEPRYLLQIGEGTCGHTFRFFACEDGTLNRISKKFEQEIARACVACRVIDSEKQTPSWRAHMEELEATRRERSESNSECGTTDDESDHPVAS